VRLAAVEEAAEIVAHFLACVVVVARLEV